MILVDSNIPMYLIGSHHRHKIDAQHLLEECIASERRLVTDVEVFQEILHRYVAIGRREAIQPAFDVLSGIVDEVLAVMEQDVMRAREIILGSVNLSARDAVHIAVMERNGIETIMSFDKGFDGFPGVLRLGG
jgi:predicted nucleic acid-binding protein